MIIELLLTAFYNIISLLFSPINIPRIPDDVFSYIETFISYIATGKAILSQFVPIDYFLILFGIVVVIESAILIYHFVMWILKKIPMVGIK